MAVCGGGLSGEPESGGGEAVDFCGVGDQLLVGLGGVEEVVGELGGELGQFLQYENRAFRRSDRLVSRGRRFAKRENRRFASKGNR